MEGYILVIIFVYAIITIVISMECKGIAEKKGYKDNVVYGGYGFILNIVGLFIVMALPDLNMQKKINEQNEMLKMVFDRLIEVKSEG
jgi:hypothetical protein